MPESISPNGIATFNSIFWDTDRSGKDIFTFGLKPDATLATLVDIETEQIPTGPEIKSVQAFPNPTLDGHYTLIVFLNHTADLAIQVFDAFQRLISSEKRSGNSKYQISGFLNSGPGVYTILFLTQSDETSLKIIKE